MDIAFIDVETTGLDPDVHELIEVAAIRVDWTTLQLVAVPVTAKIRPKRLDLADPGALEVNGYSDEAWADAVELGEALGRIAPVIEGAMIAGHNPFFDWSFLERGYACAGLPLPQVDYHRLDTASLAWILATEANASVSLDAACGALGVKRPTPHAALSDAMASLEVARGVSEIFLSWRAF